ncbi:MAG: helix-turn-helix transcriptional regulator [Bacteroidales bacterium]|jgi:transcriptional regulator with XRE-family HTH domain|nr:helix-turn-helix transcriptional regulator [Bacteroidales bacterium]MDD4058616.1 helix-turn-helix transcriptional regulator [Bacteroidales bacterium]
MDDIKKRFGDNVKKIRISKGLSQESLANQCDIDRTYLPGIENGKRNVSLQIIEKLAKGLNINIKELFD